MGTSAVRATILSGVSVRTLICSFGCSSEYTPYLFVLGFDAVSVHRFDAVSVHRTMFGARTHHT
eukprot:m.1630583 g.1630583  ORF g.1630583 m.1630583 type:complete len:64 (+) comp25398_c0_seq19:3004-3195(+)